MERNAKHPSWFLPCMMLALGIVVGGGIVFLMEKPALDSWNAAGGEMSAKIQDYNSAGTILYEETPADAPSGIPILNGMATIAIAGMPVPAQHGKLVPRWYIPAKVKPLMLGDGRNASVLYVDVKTHQTDGPYPAAVLPQ